jgi:pyruvate,water dikinase
MRYVKPLSLVRLADSNEVGGKAAVLGELLSAGFQVPAGFVITAAALQDAAPPRGDTPDGNAEVIAATPLPHRLVAELRQALTELGDGPVAVRSSATDEDSAQASFAGQYESVLNVEGLDALTDAVRRCWASGLSARMAVYRADRPATGAIGVLVQRMVAADVAGVAFSANPVTGDTGQTLVSAVPGLGDRLTAGQVTPDEWVVRGDTTELRSGTLNALQAEQARAVADLTKRAAAHFGGPQDVEWAISGPTVWLVQSRPITALPDFLPEATPVPVEVPAGFWTRGPGSDRPWTPMQRSVYLPVLAEHIKEMFAFSILGPPQAREIGGWVYLSMGREGDPGALTARAERIGAAVAADEPRLIIRRWHAEWKPAFASRIAELRDVDLAAVADDRFEAHVRTLTGLFAELHAVYFRLVGASSLVLGELGLACQELLGWSPEQTIRLRAGLRGDHMAAIAALAGLARAANARPAVRAALEHADSSTADRLADLDPEFAAAFWGYHRAYAHRTGGFDITEATLAEQPRVLLNLIRAQLRRPFDVEAERDALDRRVSAIVAQAETLLADRSADERERFHAVLAASDANTEVRDEKVYYAVSAWALLRYAALEGGRRLAGRGQIARGDDALFLECDEMLDALRTGARQHDRVRLRRAQDAWASANPGPPSHGAPPAGSPVTNQQLTDLSPEARRAIQASFWAMQLWAGGPAQQADRDGALRGTAASAGQYTGPVRIITCLAEFGKLHPGDVLVCPETTAQWAVLFPNLGALVADRGGLLSHPAIIAREYGVPAVVATGRATSVLHDDQIVTVDGSAGTVRPV